MTVAIYERPEAASVEAQLVQLAPRFAAVLGRTMAPERLIRTIMISLERTPKLYQCNRQSIFDAASTAACLGLEVDNATGQGFLIPFRERAQFVTGYKGYNTLGARASFAIRGAVVRDGDAFEYDIPAGKVMHRPILGNSKRIVGAWALAASNSLPSLAVVLSIDELMAVKDKSQGAKKPDSPWNNAAIGFPAMCEKTAKRRLARCMPLNVIQLAAALDEAVEERNLNAWITPERGLLVDGASTFAPTTSGTPTLDLAAGEFERLPGELQRKATALRDFLNAAESTAQLNKRWARAETASLREQIRIASAEASDALADVFDKRHAVLSELEESSQSGE